MTFTIKEFDLNLEKPENSIFISYSQYSLFQKCPLAWKLKYINKIKIDEPSIHTMFGTSMHNVIQHWLKVLYESTIKKADELDFSQMLMDELKQNYAADVQKYKKHYSTKEELSEFYIDGLETLNYLRRKRRVYFDKKRWELVGIEMPLMVSPDSDNPTVTLISYLDLVFRRKTDNKIIIIDLKTSTRGWNDWQKKDETKIDQLMMYKIYFAQQYGISIDDIEVEFYILKRKVNPDLAFPERRVQTFKPAQGKIKCNQTTKNFKKFISTCFLPSGQYNSEYDYPINVGKNFSNCRFCDFKDRDDLCPKNKRICKE